MTTEKVRTILEKALGSDVDLDTAVRGVNEAWDSLASLGILFELEETFQLTFSEEEIGELNSLNEIVAIIETRNQS